MTIKKVRDECSQKNSRDGMSPTVWWAEVTSGQVSSHYDDINASQMAGINDPAGPVLAGPVFQSKNEIPFLQICDWI